MANQEHLDILKQGVEVWNEWRKNHPVILPDLSGANLSWADLNVADLNGADLNVADLNGADLRSANLRRAHLNGADLRRADLSGADLSVADLNGANLSEADLNGANLSVADLSGANLRRADLSGANLSEVSLGEADLSAAIVGWSIFATLDLRSVKGLETLNHLGPSSIGIDTLERSQGEIPEAFLRGAGVSDTFIEYTRSLVAKPIDYYACFISYSSKDQSFAERLHTDLQAKRVRCWYAPHDMRIGDEIRSRIDETILLYDRLLIILSEHSVRSHWVKHEVETALGKEREDIPNVLFPIRLDDAVMASKTGWASHIRLTRHIGDFTNWKTHDEYTKAFDRLLRDLKAASK